KTYSSAPGGWFARRWSCRGSGGQPRHLCHGHLSPPPPRSLPAGFNLIKRFDLLKISSIKKVRGLRGPAVLRLGAVPLVQPTRQVFPRGLPPEFTLVLTLLLKKNSTGEHWYLFQVTDRQGYPQLSLSVHGPEKSLEFQARAPGTTFVSTVFAGKAVSSLFDGRWHKVVVAVQSRAVSLHLDCGSISSKPLAPRRALATEGNAFLGLDAARGTPIRFDLQQAHIYCDAELARQEGCCEISASGCQPEAPKTRRQAELMQSSNLIELSPQQPQGRVYTRCFCLEEPLGSVRLCARSQGHTWARGQRCHLAALVLLQGGKGKRGLPGSYGSKGEKGDRVSVPSRAPPAQGCSGPWGPHCPGQKGEKGDGGLQGKPGRPGRDGRPGEICVVGPKGQKGDPGLVGPEGLAGEPGPPGKPGSPGIGFPGKPVRGRAVGHRHGRGAARCPVGLKRGAGGQEGPAGRPVSGGQRGGWGGSRWVLGAQGVLGSSLPLQGLPGDKGDPGVRGLKGEKVSTATGPRAAPGCPQPGSDRAVPPPRASPAGSAPRLRRRWKGQRRCWPCPEHRGSGAGTGEREGTERGSRWQTGDGAAGSPGDPGAPGMDGLPGLAGEPGIRGPAGPKGEKVRTPQRWGGPRHPLLHPPPTSHRPHLPCSAPFFTGRLLRAVPRAAGAALRRGGHPGKTRGQRGPRRPGHRPAWQTRECPRPMDPQAPPQPRAPAVTELCCRASRGCRGSEVPPGPRGCR
uniref:Collagen alpha-1(XVI) chain n=1 Tax=Anser cygnoides TaxID=8845 RepID=A0A8B9IM50_ANSCY